MFGDNLEMLQESLIFKLQFNVPSTSHMLMLVYLAPPHL